MSKRNIEKHILMNKAEAQDLQKNVTLFVKKSLKWYVPGNNEGTTATIKALYSFCSILLSFIISVHLLVDKPEFVNGILSCY